MSYSYLLLKLLFLEEYLGDSFDNVVSCSGVVYNSSVMIIYFIPHFILRCIIFFNIMIYNFICEITCWSIICIKGGDPSGPRIFLKN